MTTNTERLAQALRELADKFSEGWHDGIKIDSYDVMALIDAADVLATQAEQQAGPVGAECRFAGEAEWSRCSLEHHKLVQANPGDWPGYETRALYTHPAPSQERDKVDAEALRPDLLTRLRFTLNDAEKKLTDSQLVRRAHELAQKARNWDEWDDAQTAIEEQMPEGWSVVLNCSPGDWSIDLIDPEGERVQFEQGCYSTAEIIHSAIRAARAAGKNKP